MVWGVLKGRKNPAGKFADLPPRPGGSPTRLPPFSVAHQREGSLVLRAQKTAWAALPAEAPRWGPDPTGTIRRAGPQGPG